MQIANESPFAADTVVWEDLQGQARLTVIVKATFEIQKGKAVLRPEQLPIFTADLHYGDDPTAPVRFETDRVPYKPRADVVLVGQAHAPLERPVSQLDVSLRVGSMSRTVRVFGDRKWRQRGMLPGSISWPGSFVKMELSYERAFGGIDAGAAQYCPENPSGTGFIGKDSKEPVDGKALPNLEDPHHLIRSCDDRPKPAGFGFYGRGWMPRLLFAGTYDEKYRKERAPALPADFSYELFNGAHPDLQIEGYLRGDERVELLNLCPESRLRFNLPGISPRIKVKRWTASPEEWMEKNAREGKEVTLEQVPSTEESVAPNLDTLVIMPDDLLFYEVFRGTCPLANLSVEDIALIKIVA